MKLRPLSYTAQELRQEASARAGKMSIQGVQPKISALLRAKEARFEIVDRGGTYILKPQCDYPELPENEALTMTLAEIAGIEVPEHGLVSSKDGSWTYFVKRFDRAGRKGKLAVEDFAQLSGASRETKYESSMEKVAAIIDRSCTFPFLEKIKLFERTLFSFLVGNEDMHLKNFSLITRDGKHELSPAYDLVNSTIALASPQEEMALPLRGKKSKLTADDFTAYFGRDRLGLNDNVIEDLVSRLRLCFPRWKELIRKSHLSAGMKKRYEALLTKRAMLFDVKLLKAIS